MTLRPVVVAGVASPLTPASCSPTGASSAKDRNQSSPIDGMISLDAVRLAWAQT
jgi:hypothetical protein